MRLFYLRYPEGKFKAVTFSYDDGVREDLKLVEIMNRYSIKGTFNLNSAWLGTNDNSPRLTENEIKRSILDKGHEIAIHGATHKAAGMVTSSTYIQDVLNCRLELEKRFGVLVRGSAYADSGITNLRPDVTYESIKTILKNLGVVYARTLGGDNSSFTLPNNWFAWMPTAHHSNPNVTEYAQKFADLTLPSYEGGRSPRLFYLWGHSYEFERANNWDLCEQICNILGNKEDIWYATNMEIYEYVNAFNSLIFSADDNKVYNPTLFDIWFETGSKTYCIKSGETMNIE